MLDSKMLAFGETLERIPKDFATERARLKKGKALGRRRSIARLTQTIDNLVLPNITTSQLTQNCKTACGSLKQAREGMNGKEKKSLHQIAKRGRLRDSSFALEDNGGSRVDGLEGLLVSKLNFQSECIEQSPAMKPRKQQHSRLSKTDSGFYEDTGDDLVIYSVRSSTNQDSDKTSNSSNNSATEPEKKRKITLDFKEILNQDKAVVRNTGKLTARANMCVQSHQSLHADLVAFKSLSLTHPHKGAISNCSLQTNEHCVKLREVVLKTRTNVYDDGIKQSDTSIAVLKTRRRLLDKRNSTCPPFPFIERRNKERSTDLSRATCNCKRRVQFSDVEQFDNRQCVSCPVDLRASQTTESKVRSIQGNEYQGNENPGGQVNCAVSTSGLAEEALINASRSQETVDVNAKCQEWLNRWIAFNSAPHQPIIESSTVPLDSLAESITF